MNRTLQFFRFFFEAYRWQSLSAIALLAMAGLLEGVGILTLIPMLEAAVGGDRPSAVGLFFVEVLGRVGLDPDLGTLLTMFVLIILAKSALAWAALVQVGSTSIRVGINLRLSLLTSLLRARWHCFDGDPAGEVATAITSEALHSSVAYRQACEVLASAFPILAYLAASAAISWETSVLALFAGGLLSILFRGFIYLSRRAGQDQIATTKSLAGRTVDLIQGLKPIRAMGREHLVLPMLTALVRDLGQAQRRTLLAMENLRFLQEPAATAVIGFSIYWLFRVRDLPFSSVIVLVFIVYRILQQISKVQANIQTMAVGEAAFWSLHGRIEDLERDPERLNEGLSCGPLTNEIRFEEVCFGFGGDLVIRDLDLVIPAGSFVAIVGKSGSGKTTLADLIIGLYEPASGRVLVDGHDLSELDLRSWRRQIGYVPQEMLLLNDSIRRNVTLGDDEISDSDVEEALRMADAWDFLCQNPDGVDAPVGERGAMLSGGQRQRISIARALVTRPSLLVLDEVTTALDPQTEQGICETLRGLAGAVTILSISHQPAMQEVADIAYHMIEGRLVRLPPETAPI